jgi:cyclic pyranopterin phosphate synthase
MASAKSASSRPSARPFAAPAAALRLTSDGKIRTCLFSQVEHDLYGRLRGLEQPTRTARVHPATVQQKEARHHIGEPGFLKPSRSMVHIGG